MSLNCVGEKDGARCSDLCLRARTHLRKSEQKKKCICAEFAVLERRFCVCLRADEHVSKRLLLVSLCVRYIFSLQRKTCFLIAEPEKGKDQQVGLFANLYRGNEKGQARLSLWLNLL